MVVRLGDTPICSELQLFGNHFQHQGKVGTRDDREASNATVTFDASDVTKGRDCQAIDHSLLKHRKGEARCSDASAFHWLVGFESQRVFTLKEIERRIAPHSSRTVLLSIFVDNVLLLGHRGNHSSVGGIRVKKVLSKHSKKTISVGRTDLEFLSATDLKMILSGRRAVRTIESISSSGRQASKSVAEQHKDK